MHLEYPDISLVLPASRYGQALTSARPAAQLLLFYYCSAYALGHGGSRRADGDITGAGC